jgi:transposase
MLYSIRENNGTAASFMVYIQRLLVIGWFERGNVLIMDNAAIHTGAEVTIVADLLWREMQVLVVSLPTRAPELNPIELVIHILARRLRSYRYQQASVGDMSVPQQVARIVDDISPELVLKCAGHCGY